MKNTPRWIFALAIVVVAIAVAWILTIFHNYRLSEGFSQPDREQKSLSFVNSVKQAESFSNGGSLTPPASVQQQRKTSAYLSNGLATFFSTNTDSDINTALSNYHVFFQPTQSDLQCDFTNISTPSSCISPVDTISANDTAIPVPASIRSTSDYAIGAPNASLDTRVFVLGSVYNLSRLSINMHCSATPSTAPSKSGASTVILALPTKDYATRLLMLIRPTYIRASSLGVAASMLYWVDWNAFDGEIYESNKSVTPITSANGTWNTLVQLVQVAGFDHNGIVDPISSTPLPTIDVAINGGQRVKPIQDTTPLRTLPISTGTTSSIVLYYPKYSMPTPFGPQDNNAKTAHVATVYASLVTGAFVTLADSYGKVVLSVSCPGGSTSIATVSVPAAGKTTFSVKIPAGSPAYVVACASHDMVTVAILTPDGTTIATQQLVTPLTYFPGKGLYTYGGGASEVKVGNYSSTSIPNYAEIALLLGCLPLPPAKPLSGLAVESFSNSESSRNVLKQGESLLPGESIVSQNGSYAAIYQLDGNLNVYRTSDNAHLWDSAFGTPPSALPANSIAGKCTLGSDGVLKLTAGGVNKTLMTSQPYWTSASASGNPPGADQAPFNLIVTDMGKLQVTGKFSATPVWST
jgi:hypothetical protein